MKAIKERFNAEPLYSGTLLLSGFLFLIKGIDYLLLGSIVPFVVSTGIFSVTIYALLNSNRRSRRLVRTWGVILILWAISRLGIELLFTIAPVTEAHIRSQFTWMNRLVSLVALYIGIFLYREQKKKASRSGGLKF